MLEGTDEFGSVHRSELTIDKDMKRLSAGEIGFSAEDGKAIMAHLQQVLVNQQCEAYVLKKYECNQGELLGRPSVGERATTGRRMRVPRCRRERPHQ